MKEIHFIRAIKTVAPVFIHHIHEIKEILGRDGTHSGLRSTMISLQLLVHNDEVLPEL